MQDVPRPPEIITRDSILYLFILEFTYAYSLGFTKLSILALYWHFFRMFKVRIPIIVLACATIIWLLCRVSAPNTLHPALLDKKRRGIKADRSSGRPFWICCIASPYRRSGI